MRRTGTFMKTLAIAAGTASTAVLTACAAHADQPRFPDLAGYTPVNVEEYAIALPNTGRAPNNQVFFLTPDGIPCTFVSGTAGCTGDNLPGVQAKDKNPYTYIDTASGIQQEGSTPFVNGAIQGKPLRSLPPMHSITVDGVTCGVDNTKMTACKDSQGQGFILSPSWSGWLAKV